MSRPNTAAPTIETLSLEEPRTGELLVRIVAAGICRTDLHSHRGYRPPLPIVLGHEGAGIVELVGEGVREFAPGDPVVLSGAWCGHCANCALDLPTYCDTTVSLSFDGGRPDGSTALSGLDGEKIHSHFFGRSSFATHSVVPARTAAKIPRDVRFGGSFRRGRCRVECGDGGKTGGCTELKVSYAFRSGSAIRIWIDAPSATGQNDFDHAALSSHNSVWFDAAHPSSIVFGVLRDVAVPATAAACEAVLMQPCRKDPQRAL